MNDIEFVLWFGLAAIACVAWSCCLVLATSLRRERAENRQLKARLRAYDPIPSLRRSVLKFKTRGPVPPLGSMVQVNDDGTVSIAIDEGE
jgi:hypothetical protein